LQYLLFLLFGRRNLSAYQRSVLALKLEEMFKTTAKKQQGARTDISPTLAKSPIDTREEILRKLWIAREV